MEEDRDWVRKQLEDGVPPGDIEEKLISRGHGIKEATDLVEDVQQELADTTWEEGEGQPDPDADETAETIRMLSPGLGGLTHIAIYLLAFIAALYNTWRGRYWYNPHLGIIVFSGLGIFMELLGVKIQSIGGIHFWGREYDISGEKLPFMVVIALAYLLLTAISVAAGLVDLPFQVQWALEEMMLA